MWLARNVMGALRAVKIVWRAQFESERPFEREFAGVQRYEPVSRSADGLVHVLHVGRKDAEGCFYYVMELADDGGKASSESANSVPMDAGASPPTASLMADYSPRTLRSDLKCHGRLSTADCIRLALDVVSGLAQLHRQGLVHRDVKPANIIFVGGRAKLADIGLVSAGGEAGTFVGTEGYIAPEGPGTPIGDLYALGVVLYEASTGLPKDRFPDVPAEWLETGTGDGALELHEIVLKACEAQRERRYRSADEMQADLALLQSGQSIRRVRALERRVKWAKRSGLLAATLAVLATAGVLFAGWRAGVSEQARRKEAGLRARAESAERDGEQKLFDSYLAQARATIQSEDMGRRFRTLEAIRRAAAIRVTPELRREAFSALALPDLRVDREIDLGGNVTRVEVDPSFTRYALALPRDKVEIRSLASQQLLQVLPASTNRNAAELNFSPDGRYLAFKRDHDYGANADLEVWDLVRTQRVVLARHGVRLKAITFHPHAPRLIAGDPSGRLVTWDLERGVALKSWPDALRRVIRYSPDGTRLAAAFVRERTGVVEIRETTNGSVLVEATLADEPKGIAWHPDGGSIAAACTDGTVNLIDSQDGTVRKLGLHKAQAISAAFAAGGEFLFTAGWDSEINVWNLRTLQRELSAPVVDVQPQFAPDGRWGAVFVRPRRLRLLEFSRGPECRELIGNLGFGSRNGEFSADGRWLAIPANGSVGVWDLARGGPAAVLTDAGIGNVFFRPGTDELFARSERDLFRWQLAAGAESNAPPQLASLPIFKPDGTIEALRLIKDTSTLLVAAGEGLHLVLLTNAATGAGPLIRGPFWHTAASCDGRLIAAAFSGKDRVQIFRPPELDGERWLTNDAPVRDLALRPDGRTLAVLTETNLCLWDTATWRVTHTRPAETVSSSRVAYAADGRVLMVRENPRTAALLDGRTLETLLPFPIWTQPLALSADGRRLAVGVEGRRVQLWDFAAVRTHFRELGIDWKE